MLYKIFDDVCNTVGTMYNGKIPAIISGGLYDERKEAQPVSANEKKKTVTAGL